MVVLDRLAGTAGVAAVAADRTQLDLRDQRCLDRQIGTVDGFGVIAVLVGTVCRGPDWGSPGCGPVVDNWGDVEIHWARRCVLVRAAVDDNDLTHSRDRGEDAAAVGVVARVVEGWFVRVH